MNIVCSERLTLFNKKGKKKKDMFMDVLLHEAYLLLCSPTSFLFLLRNVTFCTCAMQFYEASRSSYYYYYNY